LTDLREPDWDWGDEWGRDGDGMEDEKRRDGGSEWWWTLLSIELMMERIG
jgi:hypothetical protein